jgi:hypothetical protein
MGRRSPQKESCRPSPSHHHHRKENRWCFHAQIRGTPQGREGKIPHRRRDHPHQKANCWAEEGRRIPGSPQGPGRRVPQQGNLGQGRKGKRREKRGARQQERGERKRQRQREGRRKRRREKKRQKQQPRQQRQRLRLKYPRLCIFSSNKILLQPDQGSVKTNRSSGT